MAIKEQKTASVAQEAQNADTIASKDLSLKAMADKAYANEDYEEAVQLYAQLAAKGENADVYYNLGNAYYRTDDIANAILWYERSLLLNPGDGDTRFNLRLARSKTIDKIVSEEDFFLSRWYNTLLNMMSINAWTWLGIALFVLCLSGVLLYVFATKMLLRKTGFYSACILFIAVIFCNVFAWQQRVRQNERKQAVVMENAIVVKSTPANTGTDLFLLHAGTTLTILDSTMPEWRQIRLSDGKEGWLPTSAIEII